MHCRGFIYCVADIIYLGNHAVVLIKISLSPIAARQRQ